VAISGLITVASGNQTILSPARCGAAVLCRPRFAAAFAVGGQAAVQGMTDSLKTDRLHL
jgi:hypothetical protein